MAIESGILCMANNSIHCFILQQAVAAAAAAVNNNALYNQYQQSLAVITEASKGDTRAVYLLDQIRKYNSVAASNTVYVALPSTSAALSTAAAQSVIQEQIQQQGSVITEASKGDTRAVYLLDQIRKYNSVAASNTVYVALPSTSAALSTAAAQSVIQEQIQQQQQQQTKMIRKCIVPGCHNHSENGKRLSFHLFPTDETLRQIWIDWIHSLPIDDDSDLPDDFEEGHVCSAHFSPEDDYVDGEELDEYKPRNNLSIPSIHLPSAAASTSRQAPEESNITEEENTVDTVNHYGENNGETEPEPDTEAEGMSEAAEPMEEPSDEEDEMPLQARIKEDRMSDYDPDEDMEEDDDDDPSFDPSNPATKAIKPVTGGRGRKSTRYSESRSTRSKEPKAKAPPKETGRKNKRKSQPKKVTKKPTKRELKLREIEYDSEDPEEENNQNRSNKQKTPSAPAVPEIPESIMLSLNTSNSRITALTEEIENCHKIIKEKNELLNKLNLNINELSSKLKYFTQSEFSIKLTSVITEASKGDTRAERRIVVCIQIDGGK
ncbi:uncharacterized protein LOC103511874 [Diaphorina citri]|uniref:Uncharacterized protein LOC103511874 n=1 Tax=Diaphorina citri TaxID=121845 RepID=A0A3Q0IYL6_DIACI|nr:uncharacterized protein LOC103511874 [Diaphorina citri]